MSITLVRQSDTPRQAFSRGLWKGLAAPLMLFSANEGQTEPVRLAPLPPVKPVALPRSLTTMTDLQRIGADFWTVVERHEQEAARQRPAERPQPD